MSGAHGRWNVTIKTPMGERAGLLDLRVAGTSLSGTLTHGEHSVAISDGRVDGNRLSWSARIEQPMRLSFKFSAVVDADRISGSAKYMLGSATFTGTRAVA
jgi:hypothetical protein